RRRQRRAVLCGAAVTHHRLRRQQRDPNPHRTALAGRVALMTGRTADGRIETVRIVPEASPVANYAFDLTPARLVSGLITERGVVAASRGALAAAFPERLDERSAGRAAAE